MCIRDSRYADVLLWYAEALNELGASTYQIPSWDGTQSVSYTHLIV